MIFPPRPRILKGSGTARREMNFISVHIDLSLTRRDRPNNHNIVFFTSTINTRSTGSQCLSACLLCPGTVADGLCDLPVSGQKVTMRLEHPMGLLEVTMTCTKDADDFSVVSAGLTRTARLLARGDVMIPATVWARE